MPRSVIPILLLAAVTGRVTAATPVTAPLTVPFAYVESLAAMELEMGGEGRAVLGTDECRQIELSDLEVARAGEGADARLRASMAVLARAGVSMFGACRGPGPVSGRLRFFLEPGVEASGGSAIFTVTGAEFRAVDGSENLLTRPSRALAENVVVPRLQAMRIDVRDSLAQIDGLLEQFIGELPGGVPPLEEGGRLTGIAVVPTGLRAELDFVLADAAPEADEATRPAPPLSAAELAEWQRVEDELDGFLTVLVATLASQTEDRDLQLELLALLIDARMRINEILTGADTGADEDAGANADTVAGGPAADPLRALFLDAWSTLSRVAGEIGMNSADDAARTLRMASFIAAGDALRIADSVGPLYGIDVSRDGLRRLARILLAGETPVTFTPLPLAPDPALQELFRIDPAVLAPPETTQTPNWLQRLAPVSRAWAQEPDPALMLREVFPQRDNLDSYLALVARLIAQTLDEHWEDSRLTAEQRRLFDPLVRATAWKETCWRHYLQRDGEVAVIRSGVGAVGMMQIVGRVWRSLFDLERLESDVDYNLAAGIDILEHYFVDYALRKREHEQPGGSDNLVRATYAAYNAGPSKLSRYRQADASARARAVDRQFYDEYRRMLDAPWPRQSRCYAP